MPQSYAEAASLYLKAANQGHAFAQFSLGLLYKTGQGVPQDYVQAYKWLYLATSRPIAPVPFPKARDEVAAKMTPAQIAEAQRLAREWRPVRAQ